MGVTDHIASCLDNNEKCLLVFLDLTKAFDTVSHRILLKKLENIGIRGVTHSLFKSYLTGRSQQVKIGNSTSEVRPVECGVPQGTVLGPVLFNIYINNLIDMFPRGEVICYADDTALLYRGRSWDSVYHQAETSLKAVKIWFDANLLTLNIDKSHFMCFSLTSRNLPNKNYLTLHNFNCKNIIQCNCPTKIKITDRIKYLGIYFDSHMRWVHHVDYITTKIRKMFYKFYIIRQILPRNCLLNIYKALIGSVLDYCLLVWGAASPSILYPVLVAQKRILKIIMYKDQTFPSYQLFNEAKILTLTQMYIKSVSRRLLNGKVILTKVDHATNTRAITTNKVVVPAVRFSATQRTLLFTAPKVFNLLPDSFKCKPFKLIKCKIESWLIENKINTYF